MTTSDRHYEAIGINDSVSGKCGITLLLVRKTEDPEYVYTLDPHKGLHSPICQDELDELEDDHDICLFSETIFVPSQFQAFYINPPIQQAFSEITGTEIPENNIKMVRATQRKTLVGVALRTELVAWRKHIASLMLKSMDEKVSQELGRYLSHDDPEPFLKQIERWGRCGSRCAGSSALDLHRKFMNRVGAAMLQRPDQQERMLYTFKLLVQRHFPSANYREFCEQAEVMFRAWMNRSLLRPPEMEPPFPTVTVTQIRSFAEYKTHMFPIAKSDSSDKKAIPGRRGILKSRFTRSGKF